MEIQRDQKMGAVANLAQLRAILLTDFLILNGCKSVDDDQQSEEEATIEEAANSPSTTPTIPQPTPPPNLSLIHISEPTRPY